MISFKYDTHFQVRVLSVALSSEDRMRNLVSIVVPEYFTTSILSVSWKIVKKYYEQENAKLSIDTLCMFLKDISDKHGSKKFKEEQVDELRDALQGDISDADIIMSEVQKFCRQASVMIAINEELPNITSGENTDSLISKLEDIYATDFSQTHIGFNFLKEAGSLFLGEGTSIARRGIIATGFEFDPEIGGGLGQKEIGVVIGPPGRGKTAALLNMSYHAMMAGHNVLYLSAELSEAVLAERMSHIMMSAFKSVESFLPADLVFALRDLQKKNCGDIIIKDYPAGDLSVSHVHAALRNTELSLKKKVDLLVIDYLGEMTLPPAEREDLSYKNLVTQLRALAWKFEIPIWTAHQAGRGSHDKMMVRHSDISDSFGIFKPADIAFSLSATPIEDAAGYRRLTLLKNRFGPPEVTKVARFDGAVQRFSSATIQDLQAAAEKKAAELGVLFGDTYKEDN